MERSANIPQPGRLTGKTQRADVPFQRRRRGERSAMRRAQPKKGGGGGKGTWGRPGDEMNDDAVAFVDKNDPNYDESTDGSFIVEKYTMQMTPAEQAQIVESLLAEYFLTGDSDEFLDALEAVTFDPVRHELVELMITRAMENKDAARELTSVLLSELYGPFLTEADVERGFHELLNRLDDLKLDIPDAASLCARFLARAVADDVLPPKFLSSQLADGKIAGQAALEEAQVLLSMKHGLARLSEIWGGAAGGGFRPVAQLMRQITSLLQEYLSSQDKVEAERCLAALETPHFHHEVVYEAILLALENTEREQGLILELLHALDQSVMVTKNQLVSGFERILNDLNDLCLDLPSIHTSFTSFAQRASVLGLIPAQFVQTIPSKGRKRFVSENDGGAIKN